ncbi:uncharacterized protein LOC141890896 [Acropora palmata]|uniref:uncharacterized protein LOC141890896 n=1 Tax=Acropora palmata TaxID=6131 RepID=UPI003DA06DE0
MFSILFQFNFRRIKLHRKELYTSLSLAMAVILSGALINDFVSIIYAEMPESSTHDFTFSILVSQSYCNVDEEYLDLAEKEIGTKIVQISAVLNLALFITRIIFELVFIEFRPEEMTTSS